MRGQELRIFITMPAKGWAARKVTVEEQPGQLAARSQKLMHFLHVTRTQGRIQRAEEGLLDDQPVLPLQLEEVAGDEREGRGWTRQVRTEFFAQPPSELFRNIDEREIR